MGSPKVSIIVPVYNAEKYLFRSIESVRKQSYQNWELIIVDDGSTDNSICICQEEEKKDSRIMLICNEHRGTAFTRNTALNRAKGDYITFLDADDMFHTSFLESMMKAIVQTTSDIAMCGIIRGSSPEKFIGTEILGNYEYITMEQAFKLMYQGQWEKIIAPVNKIYSRKIFADIQFPEGRYFEDAATTNLAIYKAKKICITNSCMYYYNITPNSSSVTKRSCELLDREWALRSHWEFFFKENRKDLAYLVLPFYLVELISIYHRIEKSDHPEDAIIIRKRFNDTYKKYHRLIECTEEQSDRMLAFRYPRIYDIRNMVRVEGIAKTLCGFIIRKLS